MQTLYVVNFKPIISGQNYFWRIAVNTSRDDRIFTGAQRTDTVVSATSDAINNLPSTSLPPGVLAIGSKCRDTNPTRIIIAWIEDDDSLRSMSDPWMLGRLVGCTEERLGSSFPSAGDVVSLRFNVGMSHDDIVRSAVSGMQLGIRT